MYFLHMSQHNNELVILYIQVHDPFQVNLYLHNLDENNATYSQKQYQVAQI